MRDDTPPTPPQDAVKRFKTRSDVAIDLMASEPDVEQPLYASWDSKGRMWVTQYRQYQFPAGLKIVRDAPLDAVNLGGDRSGTVLVLSMAGPAGTVYAFTPDGPRDALTVLEPKDRPAGRETTFLLPSTVWADGQFRSHLDILYKGQAAPLAANYDRYLTAEEPFLVEP